MTTMAKGLEMRFSTIAYSDPTREDRIINLVDINHDMITNLQTQLEMHRKQLGFVSAMLVVVAVGVVWALLT